MLDCEKLNIEKKKIEAPKPTPLPAIAEANPNQMRTRGT